MDNLLTTESLVTAAMPGSDGQLDTGAEEWGDTITCVHPAAADCLEWLVLGGDIQGIIAAPYITCSCSVESGTSDR